MLDKNILVSVTNRDNGTVGYTVQDLKIRRDFMPKETKEITMEELRKLSYQPGGRNLISGYFIIDNRDAVKEILGEVEPEYYYTEEDVKSLLETGTVEQLMDCLDFAPAGVIDLVKSIAVRIKLSDINKRDVIFNKTGFNVTNAISFNEVPKEENDDDRPKEKRTLVDKEGKSLHRRAAASKKYKVVMKE